MTATARSRDATLLRAGLAVMVLAIIAGIFGMHVMTGNHGSHSRPASAVAAGHVHAEAVTSAALTSAALPAAVLSAAAGHEAAGHSTAGHSDHSVDAVPILDSSCIGTCHDMQEAGTACIPSAKAGSLTVFPPHDTGVPFNAGQAALRGPATAYAFTPSSPTPCELSISRT